MQNIEQKLVLRGPVGENASDGEPALVVGMKARLIVRAVDEAGDPAPPANLSDVASWKFILAEDWDPATKPCFIADASWNPVTATWTVMLDGTRTAEMLAALGTEGVIDIGCEIAGLPANGTWDKPVYVAQWTMPMRNRRDSDGSPSPVDPSPVPSHAAHHAVGGVDPVTPASIGAASVAEATLTESEFTAWVFAEGLLAGAQENLPAIGIPSHLEIWAESMGSVGLLVRDDGTREADFCSVSISADGTTATMTSGMPWSTEIVPVGSVLATRAVRSYRLGPESGPNADKPLAPAGNYALKSDVPAVDSSLSTHGAAAEAKAVGEALEQKANKTTLRYALVEPSLSTSGTTVSATLQDRAVNAVTLAASVTAATFTFPAPVAGYARDFFLRLVIEGSTVPTISFVESGGGSLEDAFDADDDAWAEIEPGVNVLMFTETSQEAAS